MKSVKIFYFSHVPWNWIKQRPQFIAEELSKYFSLDFFYFASYNSKGLVSNPSNIKKYRIFKLPYKFVNKSTFISGLNNFLIKLQLNNRLKNYEIIWLTHPILYKYIKGNLEKDKKILIYDCMDDALAFPQLEPKIKKEIFSLEKLLCIDSQIIFVSSNNLKKVLMNRYRISEEKIYVVNNGIDKNLCVERNLPPSIESFFNKNKNLKKLVYVGTISAWLDFDVIIESLNRYNNIEYLLFGPADVSIPLHKRLRHFNSVEHHLVFSILKKADILVMPFKLNALIESVDPVKVYEYISTGKPSLVKEYGETLKFKDFVFLYKNKEDYLSKLNLILNNNFNSLEINIKKREEFIENATWEKRVFKIKKIIENFIKK